MKINPLHIIVSEDRQRKEFGDLSSLVNSIAAIGLINPIVIDEENNLIAGERRLRACLELKLEEVEVRYFESLSPLLKHRIELEENIKRQQLSWPEELAAVTAYHAMMLADDPDWSQDDTAQNLGLNKSLVSRYFTIRDFVDKVPELLQQSEISTAYNMAMRKKEREKAADTNSLDRKISNIIHDIKPIEPGETSEFEEVEMSKPAAFSIQSANFHRWAETYDGPPFNLIHCDFPYGTSVGDKSGQSAAKHMGKYADSEEIYWQLLATFLQPRPWLSHSAHLIFWLAFDFYDETVKALQETGWRVNGRPLIWGKSDNKGIIPDANRGPRWNYETAIFASRGDRPIVRAVSNIVWEPTSRNLHTSEKPLPVLAHFYKMLVDEHTNVLDPTCGSGNAIAAAKLAGAASGLGLELNPQFALVAQEALAKV